jgi:phage tail-like protein
MSNATFLPPLPMPPHDPFSLLLNERLKWPVIGADKATATNAIRLARFPGSLRSLTEATGSFGGLRTPRNISVCEDGSIFLLDVESVALKRFDPCKCVFETVPCFGKSGAGARDLQGPTSIAVSSDSLYVCDTDNHRLSVFALPTLALRGHWLAPGPWQPTCILVHRHSIFVGDAQNGAIHRFSRQGGHLGAQSGYGPVMSLALDRKGNLYAVTSNTAYRVTAHGPVELNSPADDLALDFEPLPFHVDREGNMLLGALCANASCSTFDVSGNCVTLAEAPDHLYEPSGSLVLGPLDSQIEGCVWHRVVLHGKLPKLCHIIVKSASAEIELPASLTFDQVYRWDAGVVATAFEKNPVDIPSDDWTPIDDDQAHKWDCLIQGQPGRYLWIKLELFSDGAASPEIESIEVEYPRISLRRYLPGIYGVDPISADFTDRFLAVFDRSLRDYELKIDNLGGLFDPMATEKLDWLASWIGVTLDHQLSEPLRRQILKAAGSTQNMRGTLVGLHGMLLRVLGFDLIKDRCAPQISSDRCSPDPVTCPPTPLRTWRWSPPPLILEHFKLRRWMELGAGRLGDQAMLWGKSIVNRSQLGQGAVVGQTQTKGTQDPLRDPFHFYAHKFTVFVPASAGDTPQKRQSLQNLISRESPAHTESHIEYVSPRFQIGFQSSIGLNSVIARMPSGVTLNQSVLGQASILTGDKGSDGIGAQRIGATQI